MSNVPNKKTRIDDDSDWQTNLPLKNRNWYALEHEILTDVVFLTEEEEKPLQAHKMILSLASSVFGRMFNGPFAQATKNTMKINGKEMDVIKVTEISHEALLSVFKYLHMEEVDLKQEYALSVLYASHKYMIPELTEECGRFIADKIKSRKIFVHLSLAIMYGCKSLIETCERELKHRPSFYLQRDDFKECDTTTLCHILKMDDWDVDEMELFKAVLVWTEAEYERRNLPASKENMRKFLLTECDQTIPLYEIRFAQMSQEAFAIYASGPGCVLLPEECVEIFSVFTLGEKSYKNCRFNCKLRNSIRRDRSIVHKQHPRALRYGIPPCDCSDMTGKRGRKNLHQFP